MCCYPSNLFPTKPYEEEQIHNQTVHKKLSKNGGQSCSTPKMNKSDCTVYSRPASNTWYKHRMSEILEIINQKLQDIISVNIIDCNKLFPLHYLCYYYCNNKLNTSMVNFLGLESVEVHDWHEQQAVHKLFINYLV